MISESNLIVRKSGKKENSYYIDCLGAYTIPDISKKAGLSQQTIKEKYEANGASYDEGSDVYYFESLESARKTVSEILKSIKPVYRGREVLLTEAEIEYIRQALINEGSNIIHVRNSVKDNILKKLNS